MAPLYPTLAPNTLCITTLNSLNCMNRNSGSIQNPIKASILETAVYQILKSLCIASALFLQVSCLGAFQCGPGIQLADWFQYIYERERRGDGGTPISPLLVCRIRHQPDRFYCNFHWKKDGRFCTWCASLNVLSLQLLIDVYCWWNALLYWENWF